MPSAASATDPVSHYEAPSTLWAAARTARGTDLRGQSLVNLDVLSAVVLAAVLLALAGCASRPRAQAPGRGYCVAGHGCYRVLDSGAGYEESGIASWYGRGDAGRPTASGARFEPGAMRIAHKTLPFGTWVRIRNRANGREAVAMVNDRGPFVGGRVVDATPAVAQRLGFYGEGTARVRVTAVPVAQLDAAQREAARADEQSAVSYARRHSHEVLAEAGHVAIRGVVDITATGTKIVVGVVRGVFELGWDILKHL
ncbi:MAG TPA: septal ring lytic transglycosylase RlpA family protein [Steroidobacteraceae bacterium]|nr:septal ring lytic transglycosylase RlpA family protein [Steroidobacteraceae bacterium]